jgi:putative sigma-54 modulation protein
MHIKKIHALNMVLTDAIRSYTEGKLLSLQKLTTHFDALAGCDVEIGKETEHHHKGQIFRAEVNLTIPGGFLRAEARDENLYSAIDKVKDELKHQLIKAEKKRRSRARKGQKVWKRLSSLSWWAGKEKDER